MFVEFFKWWYGPGWVAAWQCVSKSTTRVQTTFAIPVLLRSLFAPWKQIMSGGGRSIDEKFRAGIDNLISRTIGFFVRLGTLAVALIVLVGIAVVSLVMALVWPLLPIAAVYCLIRVVLG